MTKGLASLIIYAMDSWGTNRPSSTGPAGGALNIVADTTVLVVDIGSTTTSVALASCGQLHARASRPTHTPSQPREYEDLLNQAAAAAGFDTSNIAGIGVASVVPGATPALRHAARHVGQPIIEITGRAPPIAVGYDDPTQLGADRIANALGATDRYGTPAIVVDLGTAITIEVVSAAGELVGGAIAPGIGISLDALRQHAPHLPPIEFTALTEAEPVIATTTEASLRSGTMWGAQALIDGLVRRSQQTIGPCPVIATGTAAPVIAAGSRTITTVDTDLTLWGVYCAYQLAAQQGDPRCR